MLSPHELGCGAPRVKGEGGGGRLVAVKMAERAMCDTNSRSRVSFVREVEVLRVSLSAMHMRLSEMLVFAYAFVSTPQVRSSTSCGVDKQRTCRSVAGNWKTFSALWVRLGVGWLRSIFIGDGYIQ